MTARHTMIMRAGVERNTAAGRDPDNNPSEPAWTLQAGRIPCVLAAATARLIAGRINAEVEDGRLLVPLDADLSTKDRINGVYDRLGRVVDPHVMAIQSDMRFRDHRELALKVVAWPG